MKFFDKIISTDYSKSTILIRLLVGAVFLSEGIQKLTFPELLGAGRFEKIGFCHPGFWAQFTASFEILCGTMILLGFLTRLASVPLLIIMLVAFVTTKYPILIDKGFWTMAHEYRADFAMTIGTIFLIIKGAGYWSLDRKLKNS
ncbi:DoxX family protein [Chryseobacterium sp. SC28]|uniref:DoxX family protein n=1 Tax=Chryseobacterium sp. SC28 TaxID=2268028 RepID=UPI000F64E1B2|nr:DoxX family protein [Chryseobacterium sp. SC28]RRQ47226.1 DoxX family protein [Chryseobacterium sp. SC28]